MISNFGIPRRTNFLPFFRFFFISAIQSRLNAIIGGAFVVSSSGTFLASSMKFAGRPQENRTTFPTHRAELKYHTRRATSTGSTDTTQNAFPSPLALGGSFFEEGG